MRDLKIHAWVDGQRATLTCLSTGGWGGRVAPGVVLLGRVTRRGGPGLRHPFWWCAAGPASPVGFRSTLAAGTASTFLEAVEKLANTLAVEITPVDAGTMPACRRCGVQEAVEPLDSAIKDGGGLCAACRCDVIKRSQTHEHTR